MKLIKKLSVTTLVFMLTVLGLYTFGLEGTEVSAANSTQANGTVFAGYYDDATFETPSSVKTNHSKYVDSSILGVKVQTKKNTDGTTDMRVISTVDSLNYANVGFDIWFAKDGVAIDTSKKPVNYETTVVLERIRATGNKVAYNYSPKVMDTESLYFITGTITNIKTETNQGSNFLIRPYWITYDGTKVYGESKCVAIQDAAKNNINMTIRTADPDNDKTIAVNISGEQKEAEVVFWKDGYACVNISVEDKTKLSSASLVEVADSCEYKLENAQEVYRNLETSYAGTADTTWYSVYNQLGETEFVIATSADLYGFADIVNNKTNSFADKTVYQVADIELNANAKNNYSSWSGSNRPSNTKWTPIGVQTNDKSKAFKGTFDGQDHAIIGLYMYTGSKSEQGDGYYHSGLFGEPVGATIKNVRLLYSYVNNRAYIGAIAGRAYNVTFENIYTNARLGGRQDIGGIVGTLAGGKVINCWFDGSIEATADLDTSGYAHCGGVVGSISISESTIASCLNTGTINSKGMRTGGFLGYLDTSIRLNLSDSLSLGVVTCEKDKHVGAAIGQVPGENLYVDIASVYAAKPNLPDGSTIRAIGTGFSGKVNTLDGTEVSVDNNYIPFASSVSLTGKDAYTNTGIVFDRPETKDIEEGYWVTTETHPILGHFEDLVKDEYVVTNAIAGTFRTDTLWVKFPETEIINENEVNTYTIDRPEELLGLAKLVNDGTEDFSGDIIYLKEDVIFNVGDAKDWEQGKNTENLYGDWTPIGWTNERDNLSRFFKGTFNGQGHTISGLYISDETKNYTGWHLGLFGYVTDATITNVRLQNSFFRGGTQIGSFASVSNNSTFQNLYSDAILEATFSDSRAGQTGGIVSTMNGGTEGELTNCWFAGKVTSGAYGMTGGLVGLIPDGTTVAITGCLNSGTVYSTGKCVGGFIGYMQHTTGSYATVRLRDSLNVGSVGSTQDTGTGNIGAVIGKMEAYLYVDQSSVHTTQSGLKYTIGNGLSGPVFNIAGTQPVDANVANNYVKFITAENISGLLSKFNTGLSFDNSETDDVEGYWTTTEKTPVLAQFAELGEAKEVGVLTSWANEPITKEIDGKNVNTYTISSMEELLGFVQLVNSGDKNFVDEIVYLGKDIVVNKGNAEDWAQGENTDNLLVWVPIGTSANKFAGTFDGKGHSINGIYLNNTDSSQQGVWAMTQAGTTLKNFSLLNSYICGKTDVGAIAGQFAGVMDSVYNEAIVAGTENVGGLIGKMLGLVSVSNSWNAGRIAVGDGTTTGKFAGGLVGYVSSGGTEIIHCLNTGDIHFGDQQVGGIVGQVNSANTVTIRDSLSTGNITCGHKEGVTKRNAGSVVGYHLDGTLDIASTYGYAKNGIGVSGGYNSTYVTAGEIVGSATNITYIDALYDISLAGELSTEHWLFRVNNYPIPVVFATGTDDKNYKEVDTLLKLDYWNSDQVTYSNAENKGTGNYMLTIDNAKFESDDNSVKTYKGYLDALKNAGFEVYATNDTTNDEEGLDDEGVYNAIYTKGLDTADTVSDDWVVNVTYIEYKENNDETPKIYITFNTGQPLSKHLKAADVASVDYSATDGYSVAQDKVTYHMLESSYAGFGAGSYVMQLKNGHFVVIDGGILDDVDYLFEYLETLAVDENGNQLKPIVEAWVFSHSHSDHMGPVLGIMKDVDTYKNRIYVEGFYYNEPNGDIVEAYGKGSEQLTKALKTCAAQVLKTTEGKSPQIYRIQTGQRYTFDDVTMDIMLSQELLSVADYEATLDTNNSYQQDSFNDTSTWCMFTIGEGDDAQKLFSAGDGSYSGKKYVCDMYSSGYLTVDVFTALHHGLNTNMSNYLKADSILLDSGLQEAFTQKCTVEGVVLYSYKFDMTKEETTNRLPNTAFAVNRIYARLNSSFIDYLEGKSTTFANGIPVKYLNTDGSTKSDSSKKYLYFGEGASVLTFHGKTATNPITAEVLPNYDFTK